jgi:putative transposase
MARKPREYNSIYPIHITARTINRMKFPLELPKVWNILSDYLYILRHAFEIRIHSFVLMPNHFHLIATDPHSRMSDGMGYFLCQTSKVIGFESNRINKIWGTRFHSSVMKSPIYYLHAYKYVYRNPVKGVICESVLDYPYSSLRILLGKDSGIIPLEEDETLFSDVRGTLAWLEQGYKRSENEAIRKALRKREFEFGRDQRTKKYPHLNSWDSLPDFLK